MKFRNIILATAIASTLTMSTALTAGTGSNTSPEQKVDTTAISDHRIAEQLIRFGLRNNDALALLSGAKIKKGLPGEAAKKQKKEKGSAPTTTGMKSGKTETSVEAALARAKELSKGQPDMLAMIADVEESSTRNIVGVSGPTIVEERVRAGYSDYYTETFKKRAETIVLVSGDGDTDLDLYIYDEDDNLICSDTDRTDDMICSWTPAWTGDFTIKIENLGDVYNDYTMLIR